MNDDDYDEWVTMMTEWWWTMNNNDDDYHSSQPEIIFPIAICLLKSLHRSWNSM